MKIAICDDEEQQIEYIESILSAWGRKCGHRYTVESYPSAESFLFAYEDNKDFDILLLDVEMGELSGIDLAKRLRKDKSRAEIIFLTSHFEFYGEGYEVDALHYLIKPIAAEKLMMVLDKAVEKLAIEPASVLITCEGETLKLYERDILYVESLLHYIVIHAHTTVNLTGNTIGTESMKEQPDVVGSKGGQEYRLKENISTFEKKLSEDFYRIHRSVLVNLKYIVRISKTSVTLENGLELPLARGKYDALNEAFIKRN